MFLISQAVWKSEKMADHVRLSHFSPDGDEGYPGDVFVNVTVQLTDDNELIINYTARAHKKATPINLTSHPYFNLAGEVSYVHSNLNTGLETGLHAFTSWNYLLFT